MIISFSHKFVFVKTNKTAGSSFEGLLSHYLNSDDWVTSAQSREEDYRNTAIKSTKVHYLNGKNAARAVASTSMHASSLLNRNFQKQKIFKLWNPAKSIQSIGLFIPMEKAKTDSKNSKEIESVASTGSNQGKVSRSYR